MQDLKGRFGRRGTNGYGANRRFGSISSATLELAPLCNSNIAANAIIAALSVQSEGSAVLNSKLELLHAAAICFRSSLLQLTPPLTVTRSTSSFFAASIVFETRTSTIAA